MGYRIAYNPEMDDKYPLKPVHSCKKITLVVAGIILSIVLFCNHSVREFFIPGNAEETLSNIETMINNIQEGVPISDAIDRFCEDILSGEVA